MNLLALVQAFCGERGIPVPTAVMTSTETTMVQIRYMCQSVLRALRQYEWQRQVARVTFPSVAAESQGTLTACFGSTYRSLIPATMWDVTLRRPIFGPVGDQSWQLLKAFIPSGPVYQYRIQGNELLINPTIDAGHTLSAMVMTYNGCVAADGTTFKEYFTADDDTPLFPDEVFLSDLTWRWLKQKEQPWQAAYEEARQMLMSNLNKDNSKPTFDLSQPMQHLTPGIWIPAGSWNV